MKKHAANYCTKQDGTRIDPFFFAIPLLHFFFFYPLLYEGLQPLPLKRHKIATSNCYVAIIISEYGYRKTATNLLDFYIAKLVAIFFVVQFYVTCLQVALPLKAMRVQKLLQALWLSRPNDKLPSLNRTTDHAFTYCIHWRTYIPWTTTRTGFPIGTKLQLGT